MVPVVGLCVVLWRLMKDEVPNCFYRVSVKALVLNEARDKFLITQEEDGRWELPGGGLDWGMTPQEDLPREIAEEMGIQVLTVAEHPSYFFTFSHSRTGTGMANVLYEATLKDLNFTPSYECTAVRFVNKEDVEGLELHTNVQKLLDLFDSRRHR